MSDSIAIGWFGPTHDHWEWILDHFRDVTLLTDRNVEDWIILQSKASGSDSLGPTHALLVAIESRFESTVEFVKSLEQPVTPVDLKTCAMPWCVLLGDDWVGHRRTFPLPETLPTFYWYELYDRVLPWLVNRSRSVRTESSTDSKNLAGNRRISPRVQLLIDTSLAMERRLRDGGSNANTIELALVVTETALTRQLWCDAFTRYKIQCIATTPTQFELWARPDVIVLDIESDPLVVRERHLAEDGGEPRACLVRKVAQQFPDAIIVVVEPFPRWDNWKTLKQLGADIIVAKPFQLAGILDTILNCHIKSCS